MKACKTHHGRSRKRPEMAALVSHLVLGPALLVGASLIDLFLATRVFVHSDALVGALTFLIFGAATGAACQLAFARSFAAQRLEVRRQTSTTGTYSRGAALVAGALAAVSTGTWLYALGVADPAVVFPLANLGPAIFVVIEGARGRIRWSDTIGPILLLLAGLWIVRSPDLAALAGLTPVVVLALLARNLSSTGSEAAERLAVSGSIVRFNAARFVWLTAVAVPGALGILAARSQLDESLALIVEVWPVALSLHTVTMVLTFFGGFYRTRAKGEHSLTLCSAAYAVPLVLTPLAAVALNHVSSELFPTVVGSPQLLVGGFVVVAAVVWLASANGDHRSSFKPT